MPAPLRHCLLSISLLLALDSVPAADAPPGVTNTGQRWEIAGDRHRVVLDANSLQLELHGGARSWRLEPSFVGDLEVRCPRRCKTGPKRAVWNGIGRPGADGDRKKGRRIRSAGLNLPNHPIG